MVEAIFVDEFPPFIEYLGVGDRPEMLGGPAAEAGWYLHPECMMGCCNSEGPFRTLASAVEEDRVLREQFREGMKSRGRSTPSSEYDYLF